jgi:hypothetical protein
MPPAEAGYRTRPPRTQAPPAARRTVVIRGQVAPPPRPYQSTARRGRPRRPSERIAGTRPDRAALWAVMMGVFLIVVAILTAHGA